MSRAEASIWSRSQDLSPTWTAATAQILTGERGVLLAPCSEACRDSSAESFPILTFPDVVIRAVLKQAWTGRNSLRLSGATIFPFPNH